MAKEAALRDPGRIAALNASGLLDSPAEESFDRITRLVARMLDVPVALVSLVDTDRQFFKSAHGLTAPLSNTRETPLSHSFCQHVVTSGESLVVENASEHPVVSTNCAVKDLGVAAYLGVPLTTPSGHVLGSLCAVDIKPRQWRDDDIRTMRDVAEIVMQQIALRHEVSQRQAAERQQQLLIAELHHRVKNTLTVVQSLITLSIRHTSSLEAFSASIIGRISSLAKTHTLLVEGQWLTISLRDMLEGELKAHDQGDRIVIDGTDARLSSRTAVAIGMAVHELITNAIKYGALSVEKGHVALGWHTTPAADGECLVLEWLESGGPPVSKPEGRGFGSLLLERVLGPELRGTIITDFRPGGLYARIESLLPVADPHVWTHASANTGRKPG